MNDIRICNSNEYVNSNQDFVQGSSKDILLNDIRKDIPSSPMYKGYGINPEAPPVTKLDNETLDRISYQYGIPQPSASPILKSSSMINPDSFMSRVNAAATQIKLDSIPATPNIPPLSLSSIELIVCFVALIYTIFKLRNKNNCIFYKCLFSSLKHTLFRAILTYVKSFIILKHTFF